MQNDKLKKISKKTALPLAVVIGLSIGYGQLQGKVASLEEKAENAKDIPIKVAAIQIKVEGLETTIGEIKSEQKEMRQDVKEINSNIQDFQIEQAVIKTDLKAILKAVQ